MNEAERQAFKQEVVGVFDRAAPIYDQVGVRQFTHFGNLLIERLAIPSGARVLDIAAGRGALLFPAAERVGLSGQVIGIDLAPTMVNETAAEITRRGLTQAEIRLADADEVEFDERSFDFIMCGYALTSWTTNRFCPNSTVGSNRRAVSQPSSPLCRRVKIWRAGYGYLTSPEQYSRLISSRRRPGLLPIDSRSQR